MVVTDFVDGTSPDALTGAQFAEVKKAVTLLHSEGLVFGDLRLPNSLLGETAGSGVNRGVHTGPCGRTRFCLVAVTPYLGLDIGLENRAPDSRGRCGS